MEQDGKEGKLMEKTLLTTTTGRFMPYSCTVLQIHRTIWTIWTISTGSPGLPDFDQAAYDIVLSTGGNAGASQLAAQQIHSLDALGLLRNCNRSNLLPI